MYPHAKGITWGAGRRKAAHTNKNKLKKGTHCSQSSISVLMSLGCCVRFCEVVLAKKRSTHCQGKAFNLVADIFAVSLKIQIQHTRHIFCLVACFIIVDY